VTTTDGSPHSQRLSGVRFEWGPAGAAAIGAPGAALVVVDVLSWSTAVTIAVSRGTAVYPHPWPSPDLQAFAVARDAVCAVRRSDVDADHPWSLSPAHLVAAPVAARLVLPSPNGSAIAAGVATPAVGAEAVIAVSLRNATAVGRWLSEQGWGRPGRAVVVVAAGERWPNGELRPARQDHRGAGAVIAAIADRAAVSPEAAAAEAAWEVHRLHLAGVLRACSSGRELIEAGYGTDVALAAEHDTQSTVPVLTDGAFRSAPGALRCR
jgi:2-phosphosulfolactate phosphatase